MDLNIILVMRLSFLGAAVLVLLVALLPSLRTRFLAYGARSATDKPSAEKEKDEATTTNGRQSVPIQLLDALAALTVPHSWFTSFYAVSVLCSLFWALQIFSRGSLFRWVVEYVDTTSPNMTVSQVKITWILMLAQGGRRLYECLLFHKPSQSRMWIGHWIMGIGFYLGINLAVWIEGSAALRTYRFGLKDLQIPAPSLRSFVSTPLFFFASGIQHDCHAYLASLKSSPPTTKERRGQPQPLASEYKVPDHPAFHQVLTPHYLAECIIYFALAIISAPRGHLINFTVTTALIFVAVNLGVTAHGTKQWYEQKFGKSKMQGRWKMVPYVF